MAVYDDQMERGFPGMKCDSGDDRVESFPAFAAIPFGRVVATNPATAQSTPLDNPPVNLPTGAFTQGRGVSLHSHAVSNTPDGYAQYDCVSVMTRGLCYVECAASTALTVNGPLEVDGQGRAAATGIALNNAVIRGPVVTLANGQYMVPVELHSPMAVPEAA